MGYNMYGTSVRMANLKSFSPINCFTADYNSERKETSVICVEPKLSELSTTTKAAHCSLALLLTSLYFP